MFLSGALVCLLTSGVNDHEAHQFIFHYPLAKAHLIWGWSVCHYVRLNKANYLPEDAAHSFHILISLDSFCSQEQICWFKTVTRGTPAYTLASVPTSRGTLSLFWQRGLFRLVGHCFCFPFRRLWQHTVAQWQLSKSMYYWAHQLALLQCVSVHGPVSPLPQRAGTRSVSTAGLQRPSSVWQRVELLGTALQSLPVLQVGVVAFGDPLQSVEETPTAARNHCGAVAVTWTREMRAEWAVSVRDNASLIFIIYLCGHLKSD